METKVVVISGGTSGIGEAAAACLVRDGYTCVLLGRDAARGASAEEKIAGSRFVSCDVTEAAACARAMEEAATIGNVVGLVTSAGVYAEGLLEEMTEEEMRRVFAVNVFGTMFLVRAAIPYLRKAKGSIVTVASDAALIGNVQGSLYGATKAAVLGFTKSVALELAVDGIRANCVCPGDVDTPLLQKQIEAGATVSDMAMQYPLGRIGRAEEIGEVIAFLISEKSSFMTGAAVPADGGLTAW